MIEYWMYILYLLLIEFPPRQYFYLKIKNYYRLTKHILEFIN